MNTNWKVNRTGVPDLFAKQCAPMRVCFEYTAFRQ